MKGGAGMFYLGNRRFRNNNKFDQYYNKIGVLLSTTRINNEIIGELEYFDGKRKYHTIRAMEKIERRGLGRETRHARKDECGQGKTGK